MENEALKLLEENLNIFITTPQADESTTLIIKRHY